MSEIENKKISDISEHRIVNSTRFLATSNVNGNFTHLATYLDLKEKCTDTIKQVYPKIENLDTFDTKIITNESNIQTLSSAIYKADGIDKRIRTNTNNINSLTTRVTNAELLLTVIQDVTSLTSLTGDVKNISNDLTTLSTLTNNVLLSVDGLSGIIEVLSSKTVLSASDSNFGLIKLGYITSPSDKNYALSCDSTGKAFVNVPWEDLSVQSGFYDRVEKLESLTSIYCNGDGTSKIPDGLKDNITIYDGILLTGNSSHKYTPYTAYFPTIVETLNLIAKGNLETKTLTGGIIYDLSGEIEKLKLASIEAFPINSVYCNVGGTDPSYELKYGTWEKIGTSVVTNVNSDLDKNNKVVSNLLNIYLWRRTS